MFAVSLTHSLIHSLSHLLITEYVTGGDKLANTIAFISAITELIKIMIGNA